MSILIIAATTAVGVLVGWLAAQPHTRTLRRQLSEARQHASHDRLTGLVNRWAAAKLVFHTVEVHRQPTILALVDLDHFKTINDGYGYAAGDQLLRITAARLTHTALHHRGFAARLGGDEFLLVLPSTDSGPNTVVEQALNSLAVPAIVHTDDGPVTVTPSASIGVTVYDGTGEHTFVDLLHDADVALHHAKQQRGGHRVYEPDMRMPRNAGRHGPRRRDQHPTGHQALS